jgi:hypothetical protein
MVQVVVLHQTPQKELALQGDNEPRHCLLLFPAAAAAATEPFV